MKPLTESVLAEKHTAFRDLLTTRPPSTATAVAVSTWEAQLRASSQLACVIHGCMASWEANGTPWNSGYIASFWEKFASGERTWDTTIERKAGGIDAI